MSGTQITQVAVYQQTPGAPPTLQKTGALISVGGTNTSPGTYTLLTQASSATPVMASALALASLTSSGTMATATAASTTIASGTYNESSGLVTLTLTAAIGLSAGSSSVTVSGVTGTGTFSDVDGTFTAAVGSGGTTLEYTIATGLTMTITNSGTGLVQLNLGMTTGDQFLTTISGAVPAGYNGTVRATAASGSTFTYTVASGLTSPATGTITYTPRGSAALTAMITTFFAQTGGNQAVYVLELGSNEAAAAINFFSAWLIANPGVFYLYVVPRDWDAQTAYLTLLASYESTTSKTYFITTMTLATYQVYTSLMKDVLAVIEALAYGTWGANALTALTYTAGSVPTPFSGSVSGTTATAHGILPGQWFQLSGNQPAGYNGWFLAQSGTTGSTLVFYVLASPGSETALGTVVASYYSSAGISAAEFDAAAIAYVILNRSPSSSNRVPQLNWSFVYGVTPFPTQGTSALVTTLNRANISIMTTGIIGGISTACIYGGNTLDGNQFNWWFSIDYGAINGQQALNAYVINGSNNPPAPVYLNQDGIQGGQAVIAGLLGSMVTFGLSLGTVVQTELTGQQLADALAAGTYAGKILVNAVPFASYYSANEGQYQEGIYQGYTVAYSPQLGFSEILFTLIASGFAAPPA